MEKLDWRYERKFRVQLLKRPFVEAWLMHHPAGFRRQFPNRQINNIYYDTPELTCFSENMAGINMRQKFRVRWYGNKFSEVNEPTLEVKMKHNNVGTKHQESLKAFDLMDIPVIDHESDFVYNTGQSFMPSLMNRYNRSYFISADGRFRLTVDDQLAFKTPQKVGSNSTFWQPIEDVIIELKYDRKSDDDVSFITRHFPFKHSKYSKYATGMLLLHS